MKRLETGLWLTSGGKIVQNGGGHYCSTKTHDSELIQAREMHYGIPVDLFERRLANAIKKWNHKDTDVCTCEPYMPECELCKNLPKSTG